MSEDFDRYSWGDAAYWENRETDMPQDGKRFISRNFKDRRANNTPTTGTCQQCDGAGDGPDGTCWACNGSGQTTY